jgi:hypothetical protein
MTTDMIANDDDEFLRDPKTRTRQFVQQAAAHKDKR